MGYLGNHLQETRTNRFTTFNKSHFNNNNFKLKSLTFKKRENYEYDISIFRRIKKLTGNQVNSIDINFKGFNGYGE